MRTLMAIASFHATLASTSTACADFSPLTWNFPVALAGSDEETLGEIFNGDSYYTDKRPAEDPDFDWVPRKEQVCHELWLRANGAWSSAVVLMVIGSGADPLALL